MSNNLNINTQVIRSTAQTIKTKNAQLMEVLTQSNSTIASLSGTWSGAAASATIEGFNDFYKKYFDTYQQMLEQFVTFLTNAAGAGYEDTESKVQSLAGSMRGN